MHVHTAFLASEARIREGLVHVIGGFPEVWEVPSLPATSRLTLVVVFQVEAEESGASHDFGIEMWHGSEGEQVATANVILGPICESVDGAPNFRSVVLEFIVQLDATGPREIRLTKNGEPLAAVPFAVRIAAPPRDTPPLREPETTSWYARVYRQ